jgi:hypothetical protein
MIGKSPNPAQTHLFFPSLAEFTDPNHELCLLAKRINWKIFETDFAPFYATNG